MSDEIRKLIAESLHTNWQHAAHKTGAELFRSVTDFLLEDLHAAGYEIVPGWSTDLDAAPRDGAPIQAKIPGHGSDNIIAWSKECSGWQFVEDQEPPDDWTDGVCWEVNADGKKSTEPTHWKPITPPDSD